jgi:predicted murein hydrolase (TIGR00659 family)
LAGYAVYERLDRNPLANPVLWSVIGIGTVLWVTRTPYPTYFAGAQFVHVMLGPAVVALAWPLYQRARQLRRRGAALIGAALLGGAAAAGSAVAMAWALGLPAEVTLSLAPKSVTAPVAMGIAERLGGVPALAAVFAVLTGLVGALSGRYLFAALRVTNWSVRGFAIGTASHGIGAARAIQVHPDAGAYAGLALGLQAVLASVLIPLVARVW